MSCGDNLSRGVAFPFRPQLDCNITDVSRDDHGRIITCKIAMDDQTLQLVNIYAPNSDPNPKFFFTSPYPFLSSKHNVIIGGDFNCVTNTALDKRGGNPMPRQFATTTLKELLHRSNLTDVWRLQHPAQHAFTWSGKNPADNTPVLTRIDKFYITYALTNNTTKSDIKPYPHSDHELILLTLDLSHMKRGKRLLAL